MDAVTSTPGAKEHKQDVCGDGVVTQDSHAHSCGDGVQERKVERERAIATFLEKVVGFVFKDVERIDVIH